MDKKTLLVLLLTTVTLSAYAQEEQPMRYAERPLGVSVEVGADYWMDASVDTAPEQDLSIFRSYIGLDYKRPMGGGFFKSNATYEHSQYDFSGTASDLDVSGLSLDALYSSQVQDEWGFFVMAGIAAMAEDDASMSDGFTASVAGGVTYQYSEDFQLMAGIGYASRLEDSGSFYPAIGIDWQITDKLNLRTANGAYLTYDWYGDKQTVLDTSIVYESREFAIADTPAAGNRAIEDRLWKFSAGVTHKWDNGWSVRPAVLVAFDRELETRTERTGATDIDQDTSVGFSIQVGYSY